MEITYKKTNNSSLFKEFEDNELLNMSSCQNYVPLYNKIFSLNDNNHNSINLNNQLALNSITNKKTENIFEGTIKNEKDEVIKTNVFFKLSPLLDPFKYMAGKYDINNPLLLNLPKLNQNDCYHKVNDENNAAYVDSFFTYLTSQLLNRTGFIHGLDFYGSYLGYKNDYHVNIGDDIDMLQNNNFFHKHTNSLFSFLHSEHEEILNDDSRDNKKRLKISDDHDDASAVLDLKYITSLDILETPDSLNLNKMDISNDSELKGSELKCGEVVYEDTNNKPGPSKSLSSSSSEISSRSSNTFNSKSGSGSGSGSESESGSESGSEYSTESSSIDSIMVVLKNFPIQVIALEKCCNTFDDLLVEDKLSQDELSCIIIQILMMLITYQKLFDLTHNDLHTNNIMYVETDRRFLYYKVNNRHYKVRTFGKIFKIIDFGRAIYRYKQQLICSDSFHKEGDAATQYNFEPYYNDKKSLVEPNYSFDLCRLGCSIYDFITEKYDNLKDIHWPIHKIIMQWCNDDDKRNILYKNNDEERYPDFKLYKMIARKVHNHVPMEELKNKYFDKYVVPRKEIKKGSKIMNIDTIGSDSMKQSCIEIEEPIIERFD